MSIRPKSTRSFDQWVEIHIYSWGLDLVDSLTYTGNVGNLLGIVYAEVTAPVLLLPSFDHSGNIIALADSTGQAAATYDYDPFGRQVLRSDLAAQADPTSALANAVAHNQWGLSTKQSDPVTSLMFYGCRYYDTSTGRWPSRDQEEDDGGVNLNGFVENDALNFVAFHLVARTARPSRPQRGTPQHYPKHRPGGGKEVTSLQTGGPQPALGVLHLFGHLHHDLKTGACPYASH